jgi:hypothetical protein
MEDVNRVIVEWVPGWVAVDLNMPLRKCDSQWLHHNSFDRPILLVKALAKIRRIGSNEEGCS